MDAGVEVSWRRRAWRSTALALAATAMVITAHRLEASAPPPVGDEELVYLPDAARLRPLALGYDSVLADVLWFRTISYFGAHVETDRAYPWLERMCDLVTDLDPRALHAYEFAGLILPWEAKDADAGIRMLKKGLGTFPDSWLLHYYLGVTYYLFKDDTAEASRWLKAGARLPDAPAMVARFAALMETREGSSEKAIAVLEQMLADAGDATTRKVLEDSLLDARVQLDLETLTRLVREYHDAKGELPESLDALVTAGVLRWVPPDRYGGVYEIDPITAAVRSSTGRVPMRAHESPLAKSLRDERSTKESDS